MSINLLLCPQIQKCNKSLQKQTKFRCLKGYGPYQYIEVELVSFTNDSINHNIIKVSKLPIIPIPNFKGSSFPLTNFMSSFTTSINLLFGLTVVPSKHYLGLSSKHLTLAVPLMHSNPSNTIYLALLPLHPLCLQYNISSLNKK